MGIKSMSGKIRVVSCQTEHWEFVRNLRNHPDVKQGFIQQEEILPATHKKYMKQHSRNYWILLKDSVPVGFVGSLEGDIRVAVLPEECGNGYGKILINHVMEQKPYSHAKVKIANDASLKLFESCGFKKKYYILEKEDETESI